MRMLVCLLIVGSAARAAAQTPTVRLIAAPEAASKPMFRFVVIARQLAGGGVLVNDITTRQVLVLDPSLRTFSVLADSVEGEGNFYGNGPIGVVPLTADSTLLVQAASLTMFVLDPAGKIARVASVPWTRGGGGLLNSGHAGFDAVGRLLFRAPPTFIAGAAPVGGGGSRTDASTRSGGGRGRGRPPPIVVASDSDAVARFDMKTRKLDTVVYYRIKNDHVSATPNDKGEYKISSRLSPYYTIDDFVVLPDGVLAIVRGRDYHVDFVAANGAVTSGPRIPYDWKRMATDDKLALIDSSRKAWRDFFAGMPDAPNPGWVSPAEMADYYPAFGQDAARADMEGNVWVRTNATRPGSAGGAIYDVVNRRGELADRIEVPAGRRIVGFGKGGIVYMFAADGTGQSGSGWIERTKR